MTLHPERNLRPALAILVLAAIAPQIAERLRTGFPLPAGYGAAGDARRTQRIPGLAREAVGELSAGAEGSWVKECSDGGAYGYELHLIEGERSSIVRIGPDGTAIPARTRGAAPVPASPADAAE